MHAPKIFAPRMGVVRLIQKITATTANVNKASLASIAMKVYYTVNQKDLF